MSSIHTHKNRDSHRPRDISNNRQHPALVSNAVLQPNNVSSLLAHDRIVTIGGRCSPNGAPGRGGPGGKNPGLSGSGGRGPGGQFTSAPS